MEGVEARSDSVEQPHLRRGIGKWLLLFFIVGDMIGGGIYALVGEVGAVTGGAIWSAFLFASVLALLTAFAYTELVTKYPRAGGAATYVHNAFGMPFFSFMVAFAVVMSGVTSAAALSIAFGGDYMAQFIAVPTVVVALVFVVLVALINFRGISESVKLNATFTVIEIIGLLLIVVVGVVALGAGTGDPGRAFEFKGDASIPLVILAGAALSFYALIGFEDSVNVAEETQNPSRNFPRALFGGILIAALVYLLVTFTASMVVPTDQLAGSSGPLLEVIRESPVPIPTSLFAVIALFAVANGALINMIMASRLIYGMSDQGVMPSIFRKIHPSTQTPWVAIVFTTLIAMALIAFGGTLENLANTTVLLLLAVFVIVNITVLVLRRDRVEHEHFRAPTVFPILGLLVSAGMLTQQEGATWLRAGGLLLLGAIVYGVNLLVKNRLDRRDSGSEQGQGEI
jgi:basic amino acid/polyamine antiporter, APA family